SRQLERVVMRPYRWLGDPDEIHQFHAASVRSVDAYILMLADTLGNLAANGHQGVKAGHRLLEHHGNVVSTHLAHLMIRQSGKIPPFQKNLATTHPRNPLWQEPQY